MEESKLEELANAIAFNNGDIAEGVKALKGEMFFGPVVDDDGYTKFKAKFDDVVIGMEFKLDGDEPVDLVMWYDKDAVDEFYSALPGDRIKRYGTEVIG